MPDDHFDAAADEPTTAASVEEEGPAAPRTAEDDPLSTSMHVVFKENENHTLGTWWWNSQYIKNEKDRNVRLDFLQENGVTEIYMYYGNAFDKYFRTFVADCNSRGIRVAALGGDAIWLTEDGYGAYLRWLEKIKDYQAEAVENEKFYGVHIDFEPVQLPEYARNPAAMSSEAARIYDTGRQFCDENQLLFEADVSMWIDNPALLMPDGEKQVTLGEYIARCVDTLSIMSYRDTALAQFTDAQPMIRLGMKYNKKVVLGSETGESSEANFVTYHEEGKATLVKQQLKLKAMMDSQYADYGLAIHDVNVWLLLKD